MVGRASISNVIFYEVVGAGKGNIRQIVFVPAAPLEAQGSTWSCIRQQNQAWSSLPCPDSESPRPT